ncbi:MAG TPA: L-histidine N(alpha)-methyltransferase [Conexibacter sp.]|nr:L-histidine N(alpha)-methyltransferase [Conexibacter sp.]
MSSLFHPDIAIERCLDEAHERGLAEDVLDGLTRPFKELPPKHFYDERGCELFDRITELPEYYPTRAERAILEAQAEAIVSATGAAELVELGSGTAAKTRVLLDAMGASGTLSRYVPFDVAESVVQESAEALVEEYPGLRVHGVVGDFERHLDRIPPPVPGEPRIVALLGGTIGNFPPGSRRRLLRDVAALLGPDDRLLLGTDLVKDPAVLEAAYDDSAGVTAEFNRNVLHVLNRELDADFPLEDFEHVAFFDRRNEWIEMRLRARRAASVRVGALGLDVELAAGEEIRTEISAKFTRARLVEDYAAAGLHLAGWHTDAGERFALSLAAPTA